VDPSSGATREVADAGTDTNGEVGWSRDGSTLYFLRDGEDRQSLQALDVRSGATRRIAEYRLNGYQFGSRQSVSTSALSLSPDGKRLAVTRTKLDSDIFLVEGLKPPRSFWQRFFRISR
jgi:Tol biopolymer transport system component